MRRSEQDDRYIKFLFRNNNSKHNILYYFEEKMKKNLEILEIEAKLDKNEKKYWRVKTAKGWMSCWDVVVKDAIRDAVNKSDSGIACCDVIEKKGTNFRGEETIFYNITKCYGEAEQGIMGGEMVNGTEHVDEKPEVVRPGLTQTGHENIHKKDYANNHTTMLKDPTGMSVEVFCEFVKLINKSITPEEAKALMKESIDIIEQAKEAFE